MVNRSLSGAWWLLELLIHRHYVMDTDKERWRIPMGASRVLPAHSVVHASVVKRMEDPRAQYKPRNVLWAYLQPHPGSQPGTSANLGGYFRYEPPPQK